MALIWILCVLMLFKGHTCFWNEGCDILSAEGCVCIGYEDPHVICTDLELTVLPPIGRITLDYLDISGNSFTVIDTDFFGECIMKELAINYNTHPLILKEYCLNSIQRASLFNLHLTNNHLFEIPSFVRNLNVLITLDLSYNEIDAIEGDSLDGLGNLRRLDLRGNPMYAISMQVYRDVPMIQELAITFVDITEREDNLTDMFGPTDSAARYSFHEITSLELTDVYLDHFRFLRSFTKLRTLTMENCGLFDANLRQYDDVLLQSGSSLETINLAHNQLLKFPIVLLKPCHRLKHIDVSHNHIVSIRDVGATLPLEYIDLSHNRIRRLISYHFRTYTKLTYLDLSNNIISRILPGSFSALHNLEVLDLSHNMLMTLQRSVFPPELPVRLTMIIRENIFQCECSMDWLIQAVGDQASTGIGLFDWFDVYNVACGFIPLLEIYEEGPTCNNL